MTQAPSRPVGPVPAPAPGLVRVTVASGTRRVDLVLPGAVPVAELVPELARSVGLLDAASAHGGYRLVTTDGRLLATDAGLTLQGVVDGSVITVGAGVDDVVAPVYDDVVEAMTDVVEHQLRPWDPASGRRTALGAAVLLLTLGGAALLTQHDAPLAGAAAAVVAAALVAGAVVLSRARREQEAAVTVAWAGAGYAAVAGLVLAPHDVFLGYPVAAAGAGVLVVGVVGVVGLGVGRTLLVPLVLVGAVFGGVGVVVHGTDASGDVLLTVVLVLAVLAGSVLPWAALAATGTRVEPLTDPIADPTHDPSGLPVDAQRVAADARVAHEVLVGISATVGVLLVLVAPVAVSRGLAGTLLVVVACLVVMLRSRQYRTGAEVLVGLGSGVLGLAAVAASALVLWPGWRPTAAVVLAASGALLLVATLLPAAPSVRRSRLGDVLEGACLLALLPLLVVASGLLAAITG